ncbi:hypothetical protein RhiirA4_484269 [Rhizophagus irregularis]|uniref:Uncharacterized protein n=1 Tax=Rhizophagus irregularis TaxID=588596 RepID=A0A2I1HNM8_9GLOM|nr:hypothetical protein RhiirA4_484269 [Rhizophagus irregularis]
MSNMGDLVKNPNNAEDFLKFILYNSEMFLHVVTTQLSSFVENSFLKTLFDKSSQAMDKAQLLVDTFGDVYGDIGDDTESECPSDNDELFTSTSLSNVKTMYLKHFQYCQMWKLELRTGQPNSGNLI